MRYGLRRCPGQVSRLFSRGASMGGITNLFPHLPHALQTMEHVAAPQQLPATDKIYAESTLARPRESKTASPGWATTTYGTHARHR